MGGIHDPGGPNWIEHQCGDDCTFAENKVNFAFLNFLRGMCSRPAMYVGNCDGGPLHTVFTFLRGYSIGFANGQGNWGLSGNWSVIARFERWVRIKHAVNHPAWGTERVLYHFNNHDEQQALAAVPELFEKYLQEVNPSVDKEDYETWNNNFAHDEAALKKAIITTYGIDIVAAPFCVSCTEAAWREANAEKAVDKPADNSDTPPHDSSVE